MRLAIATMFAASCIQSWASDAPETFIGTWMYHGNDAFLGLNLKANGECRIVGGLTPSTSGHVVECAYVVEGSNITINWQHQINGHVPAPSRLVFVSDQNLIRFEGESERVLRRAKTLPVR